MSGIEIAVISAAGVNTTLNVISHSRGVWATIVRWWYRMWYYSVKLLKIENEFLYRMVVQILCPHCNILEHKEIITLVHRWDGNNTSTPRARTFWIPELDSRVHISIGGINCSIFRINERHQDGFVIYGYTMTQLRNIFRFLFNRVGMIDAEITQLLTDLQLAPA